MKSNNLKRCNFYDIIFITYFINIIFFQKKSANFLKEKVKLGEGKAFKTGKKNELGVHVVCRSVKMMKNLIKNTDKCSSCNL